MEIGAFVIELQTSASKCAHTLAPSPADPSLLVPWIMKRITPHVWATCHVANSTAHGTAFHAPSLIARSLTHLPLVSIGIFCVFEMIKEGQASPKQKYCMPVDPQRHPMR